VEYKKVILGFFTIIVIINGIIFLFPENNLLNDTFRNIDSIASESVEDIGLSYNLYLPFTPGSALSDKVEQIVVFQNNNSEKTHLLLSTTCEKNKGIQQITQYYNVFMQSQQLRTTAVYNCKLQI
jgi:hypothetical protein